MLTTPVAHSLPFPYRERPALGGCLCLCTEDHSSLLSPCPLGVYVTLLCLLLCFLTSECWPAQCLVLSSLLTSVYTLALHDPIPFVLLSPIIPLMTPNSLSPISTSPGAPGSYVQLPPRMPMSYSNLNKSKKSSSTCLLHTHISLIPQFYSPQPSPSQSMKPASAQQLTPTTWELFLSPPVITLHTQSNSKSCWTHL